MLQRPQEIRTATVPPFEIFLFLSKHVFVIHGGHIVRFQIAVTLKARCRGYSILSRRAARRWLCRDAGVPRP